MYNGPTWTLDGALSFDGVDDYVDMGTSNFDLSDELTVAMWVQVQSDTGSRQTILQKDTFIRPFLIRYEAGVFRAGIRTNDVNYLNSETSPVLGQWYHLAVTYHDGELAIYIDGELDSTAAVSGPLTVGTTETATTLGSNPNGSDWFNGSVDDLMIFNRALNGSEVGSLHDGATPAIDSIAPSVPEDLQATVVSGSEIDLTWSPSSDNEGVAGYWVYRDDVHVGTTDTTNFSDTGLAEFTTYQYSVLAFDVSGNQSTVSTVVEATTLSNVNYDIDCDSVPDGGDNCPAVANPFQQDADTDNIGDACDADTVYGTISGDVQTGVTVDIYRTSRGGDVLIATTITDDNGYYSFGDLESGNHLVSPTVSGYSYVSVNSWPVIHQVVSQSYDFIATTD